MTTTSSKRYNTNSFAWQRSNKFVLVALRCVYMFCCCCCCYGCCCCFVLFCFLGEPHFLNFTMDIYNPYNISIRFALILWYLILEFFFLCLCVYFFFIRSFKLMLTGHSIHLFQAFGAIYEHNLALLHVHKRARAIVCTFYSLTIPLNNAHTHIMNSEHTHTTFTSPK